MDLQRFITSLNNFTEALIADVKAIPAPSAEKFRGLSVAQLVNQASQALTKANVGLDKVQNFGVATQALAEAAASDAVYMTPLRVKQLLDATKLVANNNTNTSDIATLKSRVDNYKGGSGGSSTAAAPTYAPRGVDAMAKPISSIQLFTPSLYGTARYSIGLVNKQIYFVPFVPPRDMTINQIGITLTQKSVSDSPRFDLGLYNNRLDGMDQPYQVMGQASIANVSGTGPIMLSLNPTNISLLKGTLYWGAFRWVSGISNGYANIKSGYGKNQLGVSANLNPGECGAAFLYTPTTGFSSDSFTYQTNHATQAAWDAGATVGPAIYFK